VHLNAAVAIQDQLRQIGIDVEVKSMDLGTFTTMTGKGAHDMAVFNKTGIDPDSVLRAQYYSASYGLPGNRAFWSTPEVDAKLDRAAVSQNKAEVLRLYKEIQTIAAEQVPYLPLANPHINAGTQATVEGFKLYKGNTHSIYGAHFVKK
jgi:peptide/nickel transport system substrate-binding protein